MDESENQRLSIRALILAVATWQIGSINSSVVVDRAVDALVAGLDTPGLRDLAGRSGAENWFELRDLIQSTFDELGVPLPQPDTDAPQLIALQFMCEELLAGRISARGLASWAHSNIGHQGPRVAQDLVELDDGFDELPYSGRDEAHWNGIADQSARAFLALDVF